VTIVTEAELRDQLRRPSLGATVKVPAGARFTPSAQDFVRQWQLQLAYPDAPQDAPRDVPWGRGKPAGNP